MNINQSFQEFKLDLMAAYSEVCKEEKERERNLTERRRAAENARVEREIFKEFDN